MHSRLLIVPASLPDLTLHHFLVLEPHCPACWFPTRHVPTDQPGFGLALAFPENALLCPFGAWKPHPPQAGLPWDGWAGAPPAWKLPAVLPAVVLPFVPPPSQPWRFCVGMFACPSPDRDLFCLLPPGPAPGQAQQTVTDGLA